MSADGRLQATHPSHPTTPKSPLNVTLEPLTGENGGNLGKWRRWWWWSWFDQRSLTGDLPRQSAAASADGTAAVTTPPARLGERKASQIAALL